MRIVLLLLLIFFSAVSYGQDTTAPKQNHDITFRWPHYRMDGHKISMDEVTVEVYKVPAAIPDYKKSRTQLFIGSLLALTGGVLGVIGSTNDKRTINTRRLQAATIVALPVTTTGLVFLILSGNNRKKAIRIRNQQVAAAY